MFDNTRIHIRLVQRIAVIASAAALLAPAASAAPFITDTLAPGGTSANGSDFITDTLAPGGNSVSVGYRFTTDTLAPGGTSANGSDFITDTLAPGGNSVSVGYRVITDTLAPGGGASSVVTLSGDNGFNWTDAGVGALFACALMLLALIGHLLVGRRRRGQLAF